MHLDLLLLLTCGHHSDVSITSSLYPRLLSFKRGSHNVRSGICDESDPQSTFDAFNIKINLYNAAQ